MPEVEYKADLEEWKFPSIGEDGDQAEMNVEGATSYVFSEIETSVTEEQDEASEENNTNLSQQHPEIEHVENKSANVLIEEKAIIDINKQEKEQLEYMIQEYDRKISLVNDVLSKLKNPISVIDEEVIDLMQDIVKKLAEKIIRKEINTDKALLVSMINELKGMLPSQSPLIKITLSEGDLQKLSDDIKSWEASVNSNPNFKEGDVIIKSEFNEVRAILSERIDNLVRIKHE